MPKRTPSDTRNVRPSGSIHLGVFGKNKNVPIHRWYPFVEGYSADLVIRALEGREVEGVVLDPFGGSGTTALAAAILGHNSVFAEANPYMAWVAKVKINASRDVAKQGNADVLRVLAEDVTRSLPKASGGEEFLKVNERRKFFSDDTASQIVSVQTLIDERLSGSAREVARLAVGSSLVPSSNMVRRTDLRRRIPKDPLPKRFLAEFSQNLHDFADDIETDAPKIRGTVTQIAGDVRDKWTHDPKISTIVTSPPYLNGTNYCRNTKLELLALKFISDEEELGQLRQSMVSAGINNVSSRRNTVEEIAEVEKVARVLDQTSYDRRIPRLIRAYFSDMKNAFIEIRKRSLEGAQMYFDIGDSNYAGVYVPTHRILGEIAEAVGWRLIGEEVLRSRRSHNGATLTQVLMHFEAI